MRHAAALLLLGWTCAAQTVVNTGDRRLNIESFEKVWQTVRDRHWDLKATGVDWQAVHDELRPKIEASTSMDEARAIMGTMLGRLKQTHFGIIPVDVYRDIGEAATGSSSPGIDLRVLEAKAIVSSVDAASPAAQKGVKPGWEIAKIEGREIPPMLKRIEDRFGASTLKDIRLTRTVLARLMGAAGTRVNVEFVDGAGKAVELALDRALPRGKLVTFGNMPPQPVWAEWKKPRPDIGYANFAMFLDAELITKTIQQAVEACRECSGFVLDLRGNPGGIGGLATGVAGWFVDRAGLELGKMYLKGTTLNFALFPRSEPFRGPLAVLIDGCSASTAEILAGGLKDIGRARIFGTRTAGAALPSVIERLPNGDGFQYAIANYISEGGKALEGEGVTPHEEVRLTQRSLLDGRDAVLDAAIEWIGKQKK